MANADIIDGFKPYGKCLRENPYQAGGTVYKGDLVKQKSDGTVERAAASNAVIGVCMSDGVSGDTVMIADDPNQLLIGQTDDSTVDAQTDIGLNYNITVGTASTRYKRSAMEIDASTQATDSTLPLRLLRIVPAPDNALGDAVKCIVSINNHQLKGGTGTEGV